MKLSEFRVQNFRSIIDSGWVRIDDIAVIVGKNESGKTSLLRALLKFNPFKEEPYNLDREWPRGKRKDRDAEFQVVTARFVLSKEEKDKFAAIDPSCADIDDLEIGRQYNGKYTVSYSSKIVPTTRNGRSAMELLERLVAEQKGENPEAVIKALTNVLAANLELGGADLAKAQAQLPSIKEQLVEAATLSGDATLAQAVGVACDGILAKLPGSPWKEAWTLVKSWIPTFIYMDDFLAFKGTAQLDQVKQRKDANQLQEDDRTIIAIMEMAGLDLDEEVAKGVLADREQRMLDMNDASQTLTREIAARWSQKKYEVQFNADGQHFVTFVKDGTSTALVPLEERSKGFQWFFSFDMKFMYETEGDFAGAVILLDEPGMHLHAAAQRDLMARLKAYAKTNQLIYTTHLPFMINIERFDNIWVAEERAGEGTRVHDEWATADKDARFTLQAALGLTWAQSLFIGKKNLVVEGVIDFWYLTAMSTILGENGEAGLNADLVITPAGGASKVAYLATLLAGQELNVAALLDSDSEGIAARKQLLNNWLLKESDVLLLGSAVGREGTFAIEDMFDEAYYLKQTEAAYAKELQGKALSLPVNAETSIVDRLNFFFESNGLCFNKGRVAKVIMKELATTSASDLSPTTLECFRKAIASVNAIVERWGK